mgnify:CR=1 FL=1
MLGLEKRRKYLLGCSFGPDSMALFRMLLKEKFEFEVAHVNYHLREESDFEMNSLKAFCDKNKIKLHIHEVPKDSIKKNIEETCRNIRYDFFKSLMDDFDVLLIAHNQDDLIETYLMQKQRNNIVNYYGIREVGNYKGMNVYRPLLGFKKADLEKYCKKNKTPYAIDKSNLDDTFERNKIRHSIVEPMSDNERKMMVEEIEKKNKNLQELIANLNALDLENIKVLQCFDDYSLAFSLHLLARKVRPETEISMAHVQEIRKVLMSKKPNVKVYVDDEFLMIKEYDRISFQYETRTPTFTYKLKEPGILDTPYFYLDFSKGAKDRNIKSSDYPLTIRKGKPDDVYYIKHYKKTLRRLFIDWKVPTSLRKRWPVIVNKDGIIRYIPRYRKEFTVNSTVNFYVK